MRIGLFTDTYLPATNGISYVIDIIKKDLEAEGHTVWVFAPRDVRWKLPKEKNIIRYPAIGSIFYEDQFNTFIWPAREIKRVEKLKLDVIVAYTPVFVGGFGVYCSKKLHIPYVMQYGTDMESYAALYKPATLGGIVGAVLLAPYLLKMTASETWDFYKGYFASRNKQSFYSFAARHMMIPIHRHSSAVVATSEKIAEKLAQWPIKQKVTVIQTGVDPLPVEKNATQKFAREYKIKSSDEIILYVGRLSAEKNIELLITAFDHIAGARPNAKLLLVGDFQHRKTLENLASKSNYADRIIFAGKVKRTDLGSIYALGDIFAFPSVTDCQALVLNEAASAGLPLVWCDSEKLNPVLKSRVSGLQAKNIAADFAEKINQILSNKDLRTRLGAGAKKLASDYTEVAQTKKLVELLNTTTKRG